MSKHILRACLVLVWWTSIQLVAADHQLPAITYTQNGQVVGPFDTVASSAGTTTVASGAALTVRATQTIALGANPLTASFGTATVASGGTLTLESGVAIFLEPGFTAVAGSTFTARLDKVITTANITGITTTTATGGGMVVSAGSTAVTARGICWATTGNPTIANSKTVNGSGVGSFTGAMTGLTSGTSYFVRAYATNSAGTGYGPQVTFTTLKAPVIINQPADIAVSPNQTATFTVVASAVPDPTYQWRRGGANIPGATSSSYTSPGAVLADNGALYSVVVSNGQGTVTSRNAVLSVTASSRFQETWANANPTTVVGTTTTLFASGANVDNPAVTYTWTAVGSVPAAVSYSVNGSHAAKQTMVTFSKAGRYIFCLLASDSVLANTNGREYVVVNVQAKPSTLEIIPKYHTTTVYDSVDKRNEIVIEQGGVKTLGIKVSDQFGHEMGRKLPPVWSTNTGNTVSAEGVFAGTSAVDTAVTAMGEGLTASVIISTRAKDKITQVWLEPPTGELRDVANEKVGGIDANPTVMFKVHVINPYKFFVLCGSGSSAVNIPRYRTSILFNLSGTAERNLDYTAYKRNYSVCYGTWSTESEMNAWSHGPLPPSGSQDEVYDPANLYFVKPVYTHSYHNNPGTEGDESIIATLNETIGDYIHISTEGPNKHRSVTGWIRKHLYTNTAPSIASPAAATAPVSSDVNLGNAPLSKALTMSSNLSVLASDNRGEGLLTYLWEAIDPPAPVAFSAGNGTNLGKNSTATFAQAGTYKFRVTITDREGKFTTSQTSVVVKPAATPILKIIPESIALVPGQTQQFTAIPVDQFGNPMDDLIVADGWKPTGWVVSGGGAISSTGVFTAGASSGGPFKVIAYSGKYTNAGLYVPTIPPTAPQTWSCSGQAKVTVAPHPVITLTITEPAEGAVMTTPSFMAKVTVTGDNVLDEVRLDGALLGIKPPTPYQGLLLISPPDGPYTILAEAETAFGTRVTATRNITIAARPLNIAILTPPDGQVFSQQMIRVAIRRPTLTTVVTIQGQATAVSGYEAYGWVRLATGTNTLLARGVDGTRSGQDSAPVVFTPPAGYNPTGDSDGDGVPNQSDLFPTDPTESADRDGDGVGDNRDPRPDDANSSSAIIITNPPKSQTYRSTYGN